MCQVWKHFIHSYPIDCEGILYGRAPGQGFSVVTVFSPSIPPDAHNNPDLCDSTQCNYTSLGWLMNLDRHLMCLSLTLESKVGWISTMAYEMRWVPLPVVYCNAYCSGKGDAEKLEITANTDVYRYRRVHIRAFCGAGSFLCMVILYPCKYGNLFAVTTWKKTR